MAFDYKKEYRDFYMPPSKPGIITVPSMNYIAVRGQGDPNAEEEEYKQSIGLLYGIAFTIKMSKKGDHRIGCERMRFLNSVPRLHLGVVLQKNVRRILNVK